MYPIKYLYDNLAFNHDGECFAYYEMLPYNYSFLSEEQKFHMSENFRQMISQTGEGKIHALQIAAETSVRAVQEQCKKHVKGDLKETAYSMIDSQTEWLVEQVGEYELDYRFFIGFKLVPSEEEFSFETVKKQVGMYLRDFAGEVNQKLMGDFVSMSKEEIKMYQKLEKLLYNKISRRFSMRRLSADDFGYLIEHVNGKSGTAYDNYRFHIQKLENEKEILLKKYDLIKPDRYLIDEKQRYLKISGEDTKQYVSYLAVETIVGELSFPGDEVFYYQQEYFDFPIDTSMNIEILPNKKSLSTVRNKKKELKDLENHSIESDNETPEQVVSALDDVGELETELGTTRESMYKLSYVIRVSANTVEELKRRVDEVRNFYDDMKIKVVRPFGDMLGLHGEFYPASKRYINDYVQYVTSDFFSCLGFGAAQQLGDQSGFYLGHNPDTGKSVYIDPPRPAQGVKGSVTNALAMAFLGALGGGKSMCNNLVVFYSVLFGGRSLVLDPKSERGKWKEKLSMISDFINIINLTSEEKNRGLLDPFMIMKNIKDAESLAVDILTFLTGISIHDGEKFPLLRKAVRSVAQSKKRGLLLVIDELKKDEDETAGKIAAHIESFTDYDFASLLFGNGGQKHALHVDHLFNIVQVADLVLPEKDTAVESYTTMEMLSVAVMIALSTYSLDFIQSDRSIYKIVDLDEAWAFLNVAQGAALGNKLVRAGRSMKSGVYFVTQNTDDVGSEKMKNNIGMKFAFRSTDMEEVKKTLRFFGVDENDEANQKRLMNLENGECLFCDIYGRVGVVKVDMVFLELFSAFDTRPPEDSEEDGAA